MHLVSFAGLSDLLRIPYIFSLPARRRARRFWILIPLVLAVFPAVAPGADITLEWDPNTQPQLQGYKLHYGTSSRVYNTTIDVRNVTRYTVPGLPSGTYYFAVSAYGINGEQSGYSNEVTAVVPDTQAPVISNVSVSSVTVSGAVVRWSTDEAADTQVEYGATTAFGSLTAINTAMVRAHSQSLAGLAPGKTYYYRVRSRDAAGNLAVSGSYSFTTSTAVDTTPPVISSVQSSSITSSGAVITWTTNEPADTQVEYGPTTSYGSATMLNIALATSHSQSLTGLAAGRTCYYRVKSRDAAGNLAVSSGYSFATSSAVDTTAPVISSVQASSITSSSAVISWTTNEPADTQVEYGRTTAYGASSLSLTLATTHSRSLSGLAAAVTYNFRVLSKDAAGNLGVSGNYTFTTQATIDGPAVISSVGTSSITSSSAVITWDTSEPADSQVEYGPTTAFGSSTTLNTALVTSHSQSLIGLARRTYYYRVKSRDSGGNLSLSETLSFTTRSPLPWDTDADGKADIAVWRPDTGVWFTLPSDSTGYTTVDWGLPTDIPAPADYDGDGKSDIAVWRPGVGNWYILPSRSTSYNVSQFGTYGDIPVPADYDGDGKDDLAVWRPGSGTWYILPSGSPGTSTSRKWGTSTDIPLPADYDGDGKADVAFWRPATGTWYIVPSRSPGSFTSTPWGMSGDIPAPGDYDGDGKTDIAVWRPGTGTWYVLLSGSPGKYTSTPWGFSTDIPVPADYDGDGKTDIAVWRPSSGVWYTLPTADPGSYTATPWGLPTDVPISVLTTILR